MKNQYLKNQYLLATLVALCGCLIACSKGSGTLTPLPQSSFSFSANDSLIDFPVDLAFIQDVNSTHTILISGQYTDTTLKQGNISLRLIGDTTGRYHGDSLLVTYTDPKGIKYYNTSDSSNYVQVDKFPKTSGGLVSGGFSCKVVNGADSILLSNGAFSVSYQD
jgi:hypothetical protein